MEPLELFSAGDFVQYARKAMDNIKSRGKNVIISGGTWFYIKSLLDDEELPNVAKNPELRAELEKKSSTELWNMLKTLDAKRAEVVHPNNAEKIIRSIEMCKALGYPVSEHKRDKNSANNAVWFAPDINREDLYKRINERVDIMMSAGLKEEFDRLIEKYGPNEIISSTIGYREFLENENTRDAVGKIKQHTRNYAKRQLSWLKNNANINFADFENYNFKQLL